MKKYLVKSKTLLVLILLVVIGTTVTASALKIKLSDNSKKPEITYLGIQDKQSVYNLALNNKVNDTYFVSISDTEGNVIYCDQVDGANIVLDYKFGNKISKNDSLLSFTVTNLNGKTVGAFIVDRAKGMVHTANPAEIK